MQYQNGKRAALAALVGFLIVWGSMESAFAVSETTNGAAGGTFTQWPMAVWYGLSVVLALIGYMKAKSKG